MNDPDGFLSRWARRKRDAARDDSARGESNVSPQPVEPEQPVPEGIAGDTSGHTLPPEPAARKEESVFDLSKLPSIESITAETDIRPFLTAGVPAALRQAALRRMWVADPKIRDFIEMAENQFDFTAAGDIPGFDFAAPTGDIRRMIAEIFGEKPESESASEAQLDLPRANETVSAEAANHDIAPHSNVTGTSSAEEHGNHTGPTPSELPNETVRQTVVARHEELDAAPQKNDAAQNFGIELRRRSHGGAMPK